MLSVEKLNNLCKEQNKSDTELAGQLVRGGLNERKSKAAVKNWKKGLMKPNPKREDIEKLADALSVEINDISCWRSTYRYAPVSARKARLVTDLIEGRHVQDALDILKFTNKRAASMIEKTLRAAIADADEQAAEVESLFVTEARVDDAGVRIGTKRWIPKDRGRAHPIRKKACHIYVTVSEVAIAE